MERLPRGKYEADNRGWKQRCIICMEGFRDQEDVTFLPCDPRHHFHSGCIEAWLIRHPQCPICKTPLTSETVQKCRGYSELVDFVRQKEEEGGAPVRKSTAV